MNSNNDQMLPEIINKHEKYMRAFYIWIGPAVPYQVVARTLSCALMGCEKIIKEKFGDKHHSQFVMEIEIRTVTLDEYNKDSKKYENT